jgi:hypothetical protein
MEGGGNRTIRFQYGEVEHGGHAEERLDADRAAFPLLAPLPPLLRDHAWRVEQSELSRPNTMTKRQGAPSKAVMSVFLPTFSSPTTTHETCL